MSSSPWSETWTLLHRRLCQGDPVAPSDLAVTFLDPLLEWLRRHSPRADPDLCLQAAHDAVLELIAKPDRFDPNRGSLFAYLCRAAAGDLSNAQRREARHRHGRVFVELSDVPGKSSLSDNDPSFRLRLAELGQQTRARDAETGLSPAEEKCLGLMRQGVRKTAVFAEALGLQDLELAEQRRQVKQVKDRIKARQKREGGERDECA